MTIITETTYHDITTNDELVKNIFKRLNCGVHGFDGEGIEENGYYSLANTVDAGTDSELRVFTVDRDDNDWCYIVGDVNGPWAVRITLAYENAED